MKGYPSEQVKNVILVGHQGSGKTFLLESILNVAKVIGSKGSLTAGTTVSDFLKEEKDNQMSLSTTILPVEYEGQKINFLDTPGFLDMEAEVTAAMRVSSAAILVIDGQSGLQVGTEKNFELLRKYSIPTLIFIDGLAKDNCEFDPLIGQIREKFGKGCMPLGIPIGEQSDFKGIARVFSQKERIYTNGFYKDQDITPEYAGKLQEYRDMMLEAVAESSDAFMEKFFEGTEFTPEEIFEGAAKGVLNGDVIPILIGSADKNIGPAEILEAISEIAPHATQPRVQFKDTGRAVEHEVFDDNKFRAVVFKTVIDPFLGRLSYVQVKSGKLDKGTVMQVVGGRDKLRPNQLLFFRGKEHKEADVVYPGDLVVLTKLDDVKTGMTLADPSVTTPLYGVPTLRPTLYVGLVPQAKGDEDRIAQALQRIEIEDRSVEVLRPKETGQLLFGGQGQKHIDLYIEKLKNQYKVNVDLEEMEIVYRETIKGTADVQGKYKKQSGGSGQYGDVHIKFMPTEEDFVFEEEIFGGSVPKNYIPAVEKGLLEAIQYGGLAGYPVIGLKAVLYDGSYHAVDSSELAFKMAASIAYKDGFMKAKPTLLEPIMDVKIKVPNEYTGDVMGDMSRRRGLVRGLEPLGTLTLISAKVPQAEMLTYTNDLKSLTQARGSFEMEFSSYEECPHDIATKVIQVRKDYMESKHL
jgi:elongation factor G